MEQPAHEGPAEDDHPPPARTGRSGTDPVGVYFGNQSGEAFASADDGDSWQQIASHLPDVLCVRAAVLP